MAFRIDGDAEAKLQLLVFEGRNQAAGFCENLNLGGFRQTRERPRLGAFGANNARQYQTVAGFRQRDIGCRTPHVTTIA